MGIDERAKGVKFDVVYDSVENLEKGEMNDMAGQRQSSNAGDALGGEIKKKSTVAADGDGLQIVVYAGYGFRARGCVFERTGSGS